MTSGNLTPLRLNKAISDTGFCSRREADKLIESGRVSVNGVTGILGQKVSENDLIQIDGKPLSIRENSPVYIAFNKPVGIICTTEKKIKNNIIDFIDHADRIFPIGRLDKASEGLIFLTSDGNIVNKILRAGNKHEKEYRVTVNKNITAAFVKEMSNGIPILDTITSKCIVTRESEFVFKIILTQGLNRQIRRMCNYLDYEVVKLERIRIMNVTLDKIQQGQWRNLTDAEMADILSSISSSSNTEEASLLSREEDDFE